MSKYKLTVYSNINEEIRFTYTGKALCCLSELLDYLNRSGISTTYQLKVSKDSKDILKKNDQS